MSSMSHENCAHPSTKNDRAKCRRSRAKFADAFAALTDEIATVEPTEIIEPADDDATGLDAIDPEEIAKRAGFDSFDAMIENDTQL